MTILKSITSFLKTAKRGLLRYGGHSPSGRTRGRRKRKRKLR